MSPERTVVPALTHAPAAHASSTRPPIPVRARTTASPLAAHAWQALAWPLLMVPLLASAQGPEPAGPMGQLKLPSFDNLQQKAVASVNISIGSFLLGLAGSLVDDHDKDAAELKKTLVGLKSVQVRSYRFNSDYVYSKSDVDAVRSQLSGPGWNRLVQVRDRNKNEDVDVYLAMDNHTVTGVAIIASDPRKFTILNVVGSVDLDQIATLRRTFAPSDTHLESNAAQTP